MRQRKLYGVPMIPFGLLAGFVGKREVRITELSEEGFAFRTAKKIPGPEKIRLCFYDLKKTDYEEMTIQTPEIKEGDAEPFFQNYIVWMEQVGEREQYQELVRKLLGQYSHYIQLKLTEDDSGVAEALTGYPAKLDQVHAKDWEEQKRMWFAEMQKAKSRMESIRKMQICIQKTCEWKGAQYQEWNSPNLLSLLIARNYMNNTVTDHWKIL